MFTYEATEFDLLGFLLVIFASFSRYLQQFIKQFNLLVEIKLFPAAYLLRSLLQEVFCIIFVFEKSLKGF